MKVPDTYCKFFFCRYTMPPVSVWFVNQMLNLSKNVIKLLSSLSSSRYRTCLDTFSDLYKECEIHQTADDFDW